MRAWVVSLALFVTLLSASTAWAQQNRRVALVIGVGGYSLQRKLPNPPRDARLIGPALGKLGFETTIVIDPDRAAMVRALGDFDDRIKGAAVALFYYAGHGLQIDGHNYLLPRDVELKRESDLRWEAVDLRAILTQMEAANRVSLVFLDACRNDPGLSRSVAAWGNGRGIGPLRGLVREELGRGTLIAYATAEGQTAEDGDGANSPFTTALAKHILTPGLEIHQIMNRVTAEVMTATERSQVPQQPWAYGSLSKDFYFLPSPPPSSGPDPIPAPARDDAVEIAFWNTVQGVRTVPMYEAYLSQYPQGRFVALARLELERLRREASLSAPPPPAARPPAARPPAARPPEAAPPAPSAAAPAAFSVTRDCADCPEMVLLPAGQFMMGSPASDTEAFDDERPQHPVTIPRPFWMGRSPVTHGEYAVFARETRRPNQEWSKTSFRQTDRHPVVNVNHEDAGAYCSWLGGRTGQTYRLPSEAEWEYAARGNTTTRRYWGDVAGGPGQYAHFGSTEGTRPVGSFAANPFGLYDMLGNVWQWTADPGHSNYNGAPTDGSVWAAGGSEYRAVRGGSWFNVARGVRAAYRYRLAPAGRLDDLGFRCARVQAGG